MGNEQVIFPETHTEHVIKKALKRHRVVLDPSDIRKMISRIKDGKYFVIARSKNCGSFCPVKREGCVPACVIVNHKNGGGIIFPLPVVYCEVKRELITVLPMGCVEFREYKKRLSRQS